MDRPWLEAQTVGIGVRPEVVGIAVETAGEGGKGQSFGITHADASEPEGSAAEKMPPSVARRTDPVFKTGYNAGVNVCACEMNWLNFNLQ